MEQYPGAGPSVSMQLFKKSDLAMCEILDKALIGMELFSCDQRILKYLFISSML